MDILFLVIQNISVRYITKKKLKFVAIFAIIHYDDDQRIFWITFYSQFVFTVYMYRHERTKIHFRVKKIDKEKELYRLCDAYGITNLIYESYHQK